MHQGPRHREGRAKCSTRLRPRAINTPRFPGITVAVCDATIPPQKKEILDKANQRIDLISDQYKNGFLSDAERHAAVIDTWNKATDEVSDALQKGLDRYNPIYMMADSRRPWFYEPDPSARRHARPDCEHVR